MLQIAANGNCPHITIAYTGQTVNAVELKNAACNTMHNLVLRRIGIETAMLSCYRKGESSELRYDVLLMLDSDSAEMVEEERRELESKYTWAIHATKRVSHVTHSTHCTAKEANQALKTVQLALPTTLKITGVTID